MKTLKTLKINEELKVVLLEGFYFFFSIYLIILFSYFYLSIYREFDFPPEIFTGFLLFFLISIIIISGCIPFFSKKNPRLLTALASAKLVFYIFLLIIVSLYAIFYVPLGITIEILLTAIVFISGLTSHLEFHLLWSSFLKRTVFEEDISNVNMQYATVIFFNLILSMFFLSQIRFLEIDSIIVYGFILIFLGSDLLFAHLIYRLHHYWKDAKADNSFLQANHMKNLKFLRKKTYKSAIFPAYIILFGICLFMICIDLALSDSPSIQGMFNLN